MLVGLQSLYGGGVSLGVERMLLHLPFSGPRVSVAICSGERRPLAATCLFLSGVGSKGGLELGLGSGRLG